MTPRARSTRCSPSGRRRSSTWSTPTRRTCLAVDHAPAGLGGELLPVLERLRARRPRPRFVLLLRDIVGGADSTRRAWAIQGIPELLETLYDAIVVFGYRAYFDPVAEYAMSRGAGEKTRFVGYLGEPVDPARSQALRRRLVSGSRPLVVGTVGGGEDGYPLLAALVEAHRRWPERVAFESILIGGPLMPPTDRRRLAEATAAVAGGRFLDEVRRPARLPGRRRCGGRDGRLQHGLRALRGGPAGRAGPADGARQ